MNIEIIIGIMLTGYVLGIITILAILEISIRKTKKNENNILKTNKES